MSESPRLVQTGTAAGAAVVTNVLILGSAVPARVQLVAAYTMSDPRPPGFPLRPGLTGVDAADLPDQGRTFPLGAIVELLECEADALIAAGAAVDYPPTVPVPTSLAVAAGTDPELTITTGGSALDTGSVPAASAFAVKDGETALAVGNITVSADSITLALTGTIAAGDAVTLSYQPPDADALRDAADNPMPAIVAQTVEVTT